MKYRKKPVIIDAIKYNNLNKEEIETFVGKKLDTKVDSYHYDQGLPIPPTMYLYIDTLEGRMKVSPGDYVIKGVNGEFYPCKPDIFNLTYEPVREKDTITDNNNKKKKIVVLTGSGISAESGIPTFRSGDDALWNNHKVSEVCTHQAMENNREGVIAFYNEARREMMKCEPNAAHLALKKLEEKYDVQIITQNVDKLHEKAGSANILHLHGEIDKLCTVNDTKTPIDMKEGEWEQDPNARDEQGNLLRPFIVFFGEAVPNYDKACDLMCEADIIIVIGTSMKVYPAAFLLENAKYDAMIYLIDPGEPDCTSQNDNFKHIKLNATEGVTQLVDELMK